jgi:hypothetical protein
MVPRLNFAELVQGYIQQRRSSLSMGDWNLPSIDVSFGRRSYAPLGSHDESSVIKCFERERRLDSNKRTSLINHIPVNSDSSQKANEPPPKKRKLKSTRTVELDKMLEGL